MNFLTRFLKIYLFALALSALGGFVFYLLVIEGSQLRSDVSYDEYVSIVQKAVGGWVGFITVLSSLLALVSMRQSVSVPVHDPQSFLHRIDSAARDLRYRPHTQTDNLLVYKPPALQVLGEKITVHLQPGGALITAPRGLLRKIQEKL
ncbi:MAG TPA: hypothetical protein VD861_15890 [Pyrinomonadaceae bacterium]|nr:hypothetical protein [Pyrinomonadaceae bacterium]